VSAHETRHFQARRSERQADISVWRRHCRLVFVFTMPLFQK
jgi:hypothetical protein